MHANLPLKDDSARIINSVKRISNGINLSENAIFCYVIPKQKTFFFLSLEDKKVTTWMSSHISPFRFEMTRSYVHVPGCLMLVVSRRMYVHIQGRRMLYVCFRASDKKEMRFHSKKKDKKCEEEKKEFAFFAFFPRKSTLVPPFELNQKIPG